MLSHRLAARLAGVPGAQVGAAVAVEVGPDPCTLRAVEGAVALAVAGVGAEVVVDGVAVPAPCVVVVPRDATATIRATTWAYAVPAAEVLVPAVLGSRSRHPRSGLGPGLGDGTVLQLGPSRPVRSGCRRALSGDTGPFALLTAPQTDDFTSSALGDLVGAAFRTTAEVDRMGQRLDGPRLRARHGHDIVSDGVVAGTVQVPGDGRATVLTADHQTTGGYPKIAVLTTAALAHFVRLPPGRPVRFTWSDVPAARQALRDELAAIEDCVAGPVRPSGLDLRDANLVTGVTDGEQEPR